MIKDILTRFYDLVYELPLVLSYLILGVLTCGIIAIVSVLCYYFHIIIYILIGLAVIFIVGVSIHIFMYGID